MNMVYRSYRVPYDWIPQLDKPIEKPIEKLDKNKFRVPGAAGSGRKNETTVAETEEYEGKTSNFCVITDDELKKENKLD